MWVKTRKQLVNLDQCWTVLIDSFYRKDEQPLYALIAVVSGANEGRVELETYATPVPVSLMQKLRISTQPPAEKMKQNYS